MLVNLEPDLDLYLNTGLLRSKVLIDKCSDVMLFENNVTVHGHNEDEDPLYRNQNFVLKTENWTAYTYAGQLAGNAFGVNQQYGISVAINSLYSPEVNINGAGQYFVMRDLLEASSISDAIRRAIQYPVFFWV